jgi:RTX calcium-binding nonapeptide repeat (4 copies)
MSITTTLPGEQAVIGGPEDIIEGTGEGESIFGTDEDDVIEARAGGDFVQGFAGNDEINAGGGADTVLGGEGDDTIDGRGGNDVLRGDAGADTFVFDPSQQGDDTVVDFSEGDVVAFSSAGLEELGLEATGEALDEANQDFNLSEDPETGDFVIEHAGGTITFNAVPFDEGPTTFAELEAAGLLEFTDDIPDDGGDGDGTDSDGDGTDGDGDGTDGDGDGTDGDGDGTDGDGTDGDGTDGDGTDGDAGDDEDEEESADSASSDSTDEAIA